MPQENVELAQQAFDAFNRRDMGAFLALMDADVEGGSRLVAMEGSYHGHDGLRRWWQNLLDAIPDYTLETVEARELGDLTLTTLRTHGHGADSDTPIEDTVWVAVDWRDKKVVRWRVLSTEAEALEALGLSEQPMSQENVELVRTIIAAVPDWHDVSTLLHPDVRFDQTRIPDGGVYEGREACGRFFDRWFGTWDEIRMTPERFIEDGDRVLVLMTIEGRGKGSGVPVVIRSADLWTIRDGKIVSLVGYPDRTEALEAVGLSE